MLLQNSVGRFLLLNRMTVSSANVVVIISLSVGKSVGILGRKLVRGQYRPVHEYIKVYFCGHCRIL